MAARPDLAPDGKSNRPAANRDELERYGVWVKAEPQDIAPEPKPLESFEEAIGLPEEDSSLPEESFLTEEEERLLGSFEDIDSPAVSDEKVPRLDNSDDIFSSLPDIEDFEPEPQPVPRTVEAAQGGSSEDLEFELSMEDLSAGFTDAGISPSSHLDFDAIEGLDGPTEQADKLPDLDLDENFGEAEGLGSATEPKAEDSGTTDAEIEDVSAEFLDGDQSSGTGAGAATEVHDVTDDFLTGEQPEGATDHSREEAEPDFEALDIELHFDDDASRPARNREAGFEEVDKFDDVLGAAGEKEGFDDLAALEKELSDEPLPRTEKTRQPSAAAEASPGLANELLLKIANELSSIRSELVTLKSQLATVRAEGPQATPLAEEEQESTGGFFDEEDDEKIALTGDELDNILSSADFTEEGSALPEASEDMSDMAGDASLEPLAMEEGSPDETLLPENGVYEAPEEAVERIELSRQAPAQAPQSGADHEAIARLAETGISPLTPAPEDTSYLEEPLDEEPIMDFSETPFVEAPLVEPDLSELSIELPSEDEDREVSGELPVMESEELPDITLDIDAIAEPSKADEASGLESEILPEFEENLEFEDISLADAGEMPSPAAKEADTFEELPDFGEEKAPEEELRHENRYAAPRQGAPSQSIQEAEEGPTEELLELDEDLFVPAPEPESSQAAPHPTQAPVPADPNEKLKSDIRSVLSYLDRLLESLPEEKIEEFAHSEHFDTYKKLFEELGLV